MEGLMTTNTSRRATAQVQVLRPLQLDERERMSRLAEAFLGLECDIREIKLMAFAAQESLMQSQFIIKTEEQETQADLTVLLTTTVMRMARDLEKKYDAKG
jgi:hypothetical protein